MWGGVKQIKTLKANIIHSFVCVLWETTFSVADVPRFKDKCYSSNRQQTKIVFTAVFVFCKINFFYCQGFGISLLGRWVGGLMVIGSVVAWLVLGGSVVGGFNKTSSLHGHPRYFMFKQKYQPYNRSFQTIFLFLMNMRLSIQNQHFTE